MIAQTPTISSHLSIIIIEKFSFTKMFQKISSVKCRPFCLEVDELRYPQCGRLQVLKTTNSSSVSSFTVVLIGFSVYNAELVKCVREVVLLGMTGCPAELTMFPSCHLYILFVWVVCQAVGKI